MIVYKKAKSKVIRQICGIMSVLLAVAMLPGRAYAGTYADNPVGNTLQSFPLAGSNDTEMDSNKGTISNLLETGKITNNDGIITSSAGNVSFNNDTITILSAGLVSTNYGYIGTINNTGRLNVNDGTGTVNINQNIIKYNYGTVNENYGTVTMYDGIVGINGAAGTVTFDGETEGLATGGTVTQNLGTVNVYKNIYAVAVDKNEGTITVEDGEITVEDNYGNILVKNNATVTCTRNFGRIDLDDEATVYTATCKNNYGEVSFYTNSNGSRSVTVDYCKIVFSGVASGAEVVSCKHTYAGDSYTTQEAELVIMLPEGYVCTNSGAVRDDIQPRKWTLTTYLNAYDTQYTVLCHLCPDNAEYKYDSEYHRQECSICNRTDINKEAHIFTDYVSNNDATCKDDGTKTRHCTVCDYSETVTDEGSHLLAAHSPVTIPKVEPTYTTSGLTEGSYCAVCSAVITQQTVIPVLPHTCYSSEPYSKDDTKHWKICVICNEVFNAGEHSFEPFSSNNDAMCVQDGTKVHECSECGYSETVTDVGSRYNVTNHNVVIDPAVEPTENTEGLTEGSHCGDCGKTLVQQTVIPRKPHVCTPSQEYVKDADSHWHICLACGNKVAVEAHAYSEYVLNNDATCVHDGTKTRVCSLCGYVETVTDEGSHINSTKHSIVTDAAVEPTETQTGLTEGSHCSSCGKVFAEQQLIPKLEITPSVTDTPKEPDAPSVTDTPKEPDAPSVTDTPKEPDAPSVTDTPKEPDAPNVTDTPAPTAAPNTPAPTNSGEKTYTGEKGTAAQYLLWGSVAVVAIGAIVAVARTIRKNSKKK